MRVLLFVQVKELPTTGGAGLMVRSNPLAWMLVFPGEMAGEFKAIAGRRQWAWAPTPTLNELEAVEAELNRGVYRKPGLRAVLEAIRPGRPVFVAPGTCHYVVNLVVRRVAGRGGWVMWRSVGTR